MNLRRLFKENSELLLDEFRRTNEVKHSGGKGGIREDAIHKFLSDYLPRKYGIGRGEVISSEMEASCQIDVVIYDPNHYPILFTSPTHSVFPVESVFGGLSIKSTLSSKELEDSYENIKSLKRLIPSGVVNLRPTPGEIIAVNPPIPVTAVVAYKADRSLEAIAKQAIELDGSISDVRLRPDFIAVLGEGIVGPRGKIRDELNSYSLPLSPDERCRVRKTKRYTLLRLYLQLLHELNAIYLGDLNLDKYLNMPDKVGDHNVKWHDRFVSYEADGYLSKVVRKITNEAINKILSYCREKGPVTYRQHLLNTVGKVPVGMEDEKHTLDVPIYEYNPKDSPPVDLSKVFIDKTGHAKVSSPAFLPAQLEIDGEHYAVDLTALIKKDFEPNEDMDIDELLSE